MAGTAIRLSTAGVTLNYAVEATAGTKPAAGYTKVPEIKETPELNPAPEAIDTTTLEETEFKTSIPGLKDLGGALPFKANFTEDFETKWAALLTAFETAKKAGKVTWFAIVIPGLTKALYFTGEPSPIGMPAMSVGGVLETSVYITPTNAPAWAAKPTTTP